ncbi:hypothetical protein [Burkholderia pseudomallei]|uniref:hypothetical protein n=1 Tax=Burkholderia pseudomallei TaxID=28450 RepID=UPI0005322ABA|nr:hypothetical protein [Burkholderia pseudomallei]KGS72594.1 hypothetical protein X942_6075 [Burkholderia pseudomallei MSHR5596]
MSIFSRKAIVLYFYAFCFFFTFTNANRVIAAGSCGKGHIVSITGPYPPKNGTNVSWKQFSIKMDSNDEFFSDSTDVPLDGEGGLGKILYLQAINAMNMGYFVELHSHRGDNCKQYGFGQITLIKK